MRSPKMTELVSGDYAVNGKLLSDVAGREHGLGALDLAHGRPRASARPSDPRRRTLDPQFRIHVAHMTGREAMRFAYDAVTVTRPRFSGSKATGWESAQRRLGRPSSPRSD